MVWHVEVWNRACPSPSPSAATQSIINAREIAAKPRMLDELSLPTPPVKDGKGLLVLVAPTDDDTEVEDPEDAGDGYPEELVAATVMSLGTTRDVAPAVERLTLPFADKVSGLAAKKVRVYL